MEELAAQSNMSTSTFHHHFRSLTALNPLQYQKQLRLHEARRLMLAERMDAANAAFQVGYKSPSQSSASTTACLGRHLCVTLQNCGRWFNRGSHRGQIEKVFLPIA